jgi:hypothetical protein
MYLKLRGCKEREIATAGILGPSLLQVPLHTFIPHATAPPWLHMHPIPSRHDTTDTSTTACPLKYVFGDMQVCHAGLAPKLHHSINESQCSAMLR